jgi:hypothetical protein
MNLSLLTIVVLAIVFQVWLVWFIYQIYLATWNKEEAKAKYITLVNTPYGQLFFPFLKWGSLVLLIAAAINIVQMIIYLVLKF